MSRRKREEKIAAEVAARVAAENTPVAALDQIAAANSWAPTTNPASGAGRVSVICS